MADATSDQIPPELVQAMLRFRTTKNKDVGQRMLAVPFFAAAGIGGNPTPRNMLPTYDDPRAFELQKEEAKAQILKMQQEMQQARLQTGSSLASSLKSQRTAAVDVFKLFMDAGQKGADRDYDLITNLNDNITELNKQKLGAVYKSVFQEGGANSGISAGGVVRFLENVLDPVGTERGEADILEALYNQITIQQALINSGDPAEAEKAKKTLAVSLQAADSMLQGTRQFGIEALAEKLKAADDPRAGAVLAAYNEHKGYSGPETEKLNLEMLKMGATSIKEASEDLYRKVPQDHPMRQSIEAWNKFAKTNKLTFEVGDTTITTDLDEAMDVLAPQEKFDQNYEALNRSLEEVDRLSPNLAPGTLKARFFDPKTPEGQSFARWAASRGYNMSAPEVAWKALRREVGLLHSKAAAENRAISRDRAGESSAGPASEQAAAAMDSAPTAGAPSSPLPEGVEPGTASPAAAEEEPNDPSGRPPGLSPVAEGGKFYRLTEKEDGLGVLWYRSADDSEFRPATEDEQQIAAQAEAAGIDGAVIIGHGPFVSDYTRWMEWKKGKGQAPADATSAAPTTPQEAPDAPAQAPEPTAPATPGKAPYGVNRLAWDATHPAFTAQRVANKVQDWTASMKAQRKARMLGGFGAENATAQYSSPAFVGAMQMSPEAIQELMGDPEKLRKYLGLTDEEEAAP